MNSPSPAQDDNLRRFYDQRAAHGETHHARFPSLSEFSDSPSIYSHAHFSPRPPHLDSSSPHFDLSIPAQYARPSLEAVRSFAASPTGKHNLGAHGADPTLDACTERSHSPESIPSEDEDSDPRMSFLGPTMRFHSPAPWETEDAIKEEGEQEDDTRSLASKRGRSKTRGEGFMKSFGRVAPVKSTSAARPSVESLRPVNCTRDKALVDNQAAHSTIPARPQVAMPPPSAFPATPSSARPPRPGLVFSRGRARTVSSPIAPDTSAPLPSHASPHLVPVSSVTPPVPTRSISPAPSTYSSTFSPTDTTGPSRPISPLSLQGHSDFVHPYANPEHAFDAGPVVHTATSFLPASSFGRRVVIPSDSIATVSESVVTQSSSTLTPDTSMSSVTDYHADVLLKKVVGSVQGKVISNPLTITPVPNGGTQASQDKDQPPLPGQVPGWTELSVSPTFNLISLQEAQAQARERSRTHTQAVPEAPFLQSEPPSRNNPTALSSNAVRLRTRTASAGSKVKTPISNPVPLPHPSHEDNLVTSVGNTGPLPRSLKQKRSGFLRLFNGKDKDKPPSQSPPPLPSVAASSLPRTPKISSSRIPVPTLSPSLVPHSPLQLDSIIRSDGGDGGPTEDFQPRESIKRHGPPLTIVTYDAHALPSVPPNGIYSKSAHPGRSTSNLLSGTCTGLGTSPASAPPSTGAFPELSLRPISTVFSAHFADHIVSTDSSPTSAQLDTSSTATAHSPRSPASAQRSFDEKLACDDDPYVIIQQLQEQIKSTRKAWQHQIWELEGQVRDLRAEIDDMRIQEMRGERCLLCGRDGEVERGTGEVPRPPAAVSRPGVVDRPRARTGVGTRFGAAT
ncbi:hypothetical protein BJY52DRAFT_1185766 [Lactarius psammicola]|nr:hypothetical protein BJY52DRAFT_1185766 [Lactarius psammicola]